MQLDVVVHVDKTSTVVDYRLIPRLQDAKICKEKVMCIDRCIGTYIYILEIYIPTLTPCGKGRRMPITISSNSVQCLRLVYV